MDLKLEMQMSKVLNQSKQLLLKWRKLLRMSLQVNMEDALLIVLMKY